MKTKVCLKLATVYIRQTSNGVNKKTLIILIILIILAGGFWAWQKYGTLEGKILINTDKTEYEKGNALRVKIRNNFGKNICFSSCYPYYLEMKVAETSSHLPELSEGREMNEVQRTPPRPAKLSSANEEWEPYQYVECQEFNGNGHCIDIGKEKAFELALPEVPAGLHRLALPVCIGCESEDTFIEDERFYSNEFMIK